MGISLLATKSTQQTFALRRQAASGRKQSIPVPASVGGVTTLWGQGRVGRSYFGIPTGKSQLFSENSSQLLAKSGGRSPMPQYLLSHLFQKVTLSQLTHSIDSRERATLTGLSVKRVSSGKDAVAGFL
jgi:hypothetical protein